MAVREIISSYDQPIILGLTPYTQTRITIDGLPATDWPPFIDANRLSKYDDFTGLIENRASDVFASLQLATDQKSKIALAVALPELLANVWSDAVWSDPPTIELPSQAMTDRWKTIDEANDFTESLAWESLFGCAGWGTSVLRLHRDESRAAQFGTDVVVQEIDPGIFFPILKSRSSREIESVVLAWEEDRSGRDERPDIWQVRELHEVDRGQYVIETQERKGASPMATEAFRRVSVERPEGVSFLPFVDMHAKRWRGRYWGISELSRLMGVFDEIDNTVSNIAEILEYHGKPMLQVPASVIYGGILEKGADKTIGIRRAEEANIARYITFDGQIAAQLDHLDKLLELAFLVSEVPRTYFALGGEGQGTPPSGVSLKLQLQNYLKKAARWQRNETRRLRALVPMALALDSKTKLQNEVLPEISHGSPLPADDEQQVRIMQGAMLGKFASRKTALTLMKRLGYIEDVDDEAKEIEADTEASIAALPAPMRTNVAPGKPNSSTDPNAGEGPAA